MPTLEGQLVVALLQERDLNYLGTVIPVIQHSEQQALGVTLNRPTTTTVRQVWRGKGRSLGDEHVHSGRPVSCCGRRGRGR